MIKSYAILSQKGGTGKTTTALALSAGLARRGKKVLLIDADQQEDSTITSGVESITFALADVLNKNCIPADAIIPTKFGYDILPSFGDDLAAITVQLTTKLSFLKIIEAVKDNYDYIIVDCPPNIFGLTIQILRAVDEVIFPAYADSFSERALEKAIEEVFAARKTKNKKLSFAGILFNKHHASYNTTKAALPLFEELSKQYGIRIFKTTIPECTFVREAQLQKCPIFDVDERSRNTAAPAFDAFIDELTGEKLKEAKKKNGKQKTSLKGSNTTGTSKNKQKNSEKRGGWNRKKGWK